MKRRVIHQWKDWILEHVEENRYELTHKDSRSVQTVVAKNAMDAENQCRQIMNEIRDQLPETP